MRVVFDATVGGEWVAALRQVFAFHRNPRVQLQHIYDMFARDIGDEEWIPALLGNDVVIISGDRGRGRPPRLPAICKRMGRTHILFSSGMHKKARQFQQARSIVVLWPRIKKTFEAKPGSRFQIQAIDSEYEHYALVSKDTK